MALLHLLVLWFLMMVLPSSLFEGFLGVLGEQLINFVLSFISFVE